MHPRNEMRLLAGLPIDPALERVMEGKKKSKKADKDYDGDGKIESEKDEVWGSRLKAAKKAGKLKESGWSSREFANNLDDAYKRLGQAVARGDEREVDRAQAEIEELEAWQDEQQMTEANEKWESPYKKGDKVKYKGKTYTVEVPDAKGNFVGIDKDGEVDLVRADELTVTEAKVTKKLDKVNVKKLTSKKKSEMLRWSKPDRGELNEAAKHFSGWPEWEQEAHIATNGNVRFEDESETRVRAVVDSADTGAVHTKEGQTVGIWDDEKGEGIIYESSFYYVDNNTDSWETDEAEPVNVSGEDAQTDNTVWEPLDSDKDESPSQLDALGNQSGEDYERKVTVPAKVIEQLGTAADEARSEADKWRGSYSRYETTKFYEDYANACDKLQEYLRSGTIGDIKKAQIYWSSLMGPMLHKIPDDVSDFIARGGQNRSLRDHFAKVQGYPVEGPRNTLS